jgi:uncharacterized membrane protein
MDALVIILVRWIHITSACIAVGGVFFIRVVFPVGLKALDPEPARAMLLRTRRVFKMVIHTCILLLLATGTFNAIMYWPAYSSMGAGLGHSLFGTHLLLALIAFSIALWLLAGKEPKKNHLKWMGVNLVVLLLTIAAASVLKYAREHRANPPAPLATALNQQTITPTHKPQLTTNN